MKVLELCDGSIGSEGLSTLAAALVNCTRLESLDLSNNDFSTAEAGLSSLSDWLQTADLTLNTLSLMYCEINDGGLEALAEGAMNNCKEMNLDGNNDIEASGWRNLSTSLQTESCSLESLILCDTDIGDDEAEILLAQVGDILPSVKAMSWAGWDTSSEEVQQKFFFFFIFFLVITGSSVS